ncbi:MAG: hypothetical protein GY799_25395 [Desulfobulbaceae bacterium]|nr:hypothetical protein [Desulfobulbaceae bacterium]
MSRDAISVDCKIRVAACSRDIPGVFHEDDDVLVVKPHDACGILGADDVMIKGVAYSADICSVTEIDGLVEIAMMRI